MMQSKSCGQHSRRTPMSDWLRKFVVESNRIEGIEREPTHIEQDLHAMFLALKNPMVGDMETFVSAVQSGAELRDRCGMYVRVGEHRPPDGGPDIRRALDAILTRAKSDESPYWVHQAYETLHPFTDGNGRSGRTLWLWQMIQRGGYYQRQAQELGFLHTWYYQGLGEHR